MKAILHLLVSYSLLRSTAYPPKSELDAELEALLSDPKAKLQQLASSDQEAAESLQELLAGYATLRRYYDTRDEEVNLEAGEKPKHRPIARKREAAAALVAVINSAGDSIHGGLYDENRDSIVQVDGLLCLLGEALPFLDRM